VLDPATISLTLRWALGWWLGGRSSLLPGTSGSSSRGHAPARSLCSVVVPARNEAAALPRLLRALGAQSLPAHQVIVVDDDSEDGTAEVAAAHGAQVITAPPLPAGWTGKAWACAKGADAATGEVLLFLDADTDPAPDLVERLCCEVNRRGGLVSVQPYHLTERPYERLSALFNLVAWMGVGAGSWRRHKRVAGTFGPCMAMRRADYLRVGGHESVRSEVVEDVKLGRRFIAAGLPAAAFAGRGSITFRMYPSGFAQLAEGWSKNFATGAGSIPLVRLAAVFAWISAVLETAWVAASGVASLVAGGAIPERAAVAWYLVFALQLVVLFRAQGRFGAMALLYPLAAAAFVVLFARSVWWTARGTVRWKGRTISLRGAASVSDRVSGLAP